MFHVWFLGFQHEQASFGVDLTRDDIYFVVSWWIRSYNNLNVEFRMKDWSCDDRCCFEVKGVSGAAEVMNMTVAGAW